MDGMGCEVKFGDPSNDRWGTVRSGRELSTEYGIRSQDCSESCTTWLWILSLDLTSEGRGGTEGRKCLDHANIVAPYRSR